MAERVGLTMRVEPARDTGEMRDCLAQDWGVFMREALPEFAWLPIPNLGPKVREFVQAWDLSGIILTGGNSIGTCAGRDETESTLLTWAVGERIPVFGVCRGVQMIHSFFGGKLKECLPKSHVANAHPVTVKTCRFDPEHLPRWLSVNSFHTQAIPVESVDPVFDIFAETLDHWAEGIAHRELPIAGVQWHPERYAKITEFDRAIMRSVLLQDGL